MPTNSQSTDTAIAAVALPARIDAYLSMLLVERGLSENTLASYTQDFKDFTLFLQENLLEIEACTEEDIFSFLVTLKARTLSSKSIARKLSALRGLYAYCIDERLITQSPLEFFETPKLSRQLPHVLSKAEMNKLLAPAEPLTKYTVRDTAMLELLYASGLRVSELCSLTVFSLDLQAAYLRVFGKGSKERIVPVHSLAVNSLETYIQQWRSLFKPKENFLFLNKFGKQLSRQSVWIMIQEKAAQVGITKHISPHTFRHSFATHLLDGGADLRSVQELLGHADITATEIYTHVQAERLVKIHQTHHPRSRKKE